MYRASALAAASICTILTFTVNAHAQSLPSMPSMPSLGGSGGRMSTMTGGVGGLMGNALPSVSSVPTGNVAGVLSYCVQNNYVQGAGAASALSTLTGRNGVASSPAYAQGQQGMLQTGSGNTLSMSGMKDQMRTKLCSMILNRAKSSL
ncbi:MAG: DUF2501 domain-containing protein [Janthinobacterium lividum]